MAKVSREYIQEITARATEKYLQILDLDKYTDGKIAKIVKSFALTGLNQSMKNRIVSDIPTIRYNYITEKTNIICTAFKITRTFSDKSAEAVRADQLTSIFAYLYSRADGNNFEHLFFCIGGALNSKDGEYRANFQKYSKIIALREKYPMQFAHVEEFAVDQMAEEYITFSTDIFYPADFTNSKKYENNIIESRIAIELFVFAWMLDFHRIHTRTIDNHINPAYQSIIYNEGEDIEVYKLLIASFENPELFRRFISNIICYRIDLENPIHGKCVRTGQKLFPATINEVYNINDINFPIWRELFVAIDCFDLVLNCICPSFPYINNWFFVQEIHAGLFDNASQHAKFDYSEVARGIATNIAEQDRNNFIDLTETLSAPRSGKFENLSVKMNKAINYAESNIILSDIAICFHMEHVGRTFADVPHLDKKIESFGYTEYIFSDSGLFDKHVFEYLYAVFCMNKINGVIHGDIHANNMTIYKLRNYDYSQICRDNKAGGIEINKSTTSNNTAIAPIIRTKIAYIIGENYYLFPHIITFSMLIDTSRAIIGDVDRIAGMFGNTYAEMYMKNQRDRVLRTLHHYFPKFAETNKTELQSAMLTNFPAVFKIFTAIDAYSIALSIHSAIRDKYPVNAKSVIRIRNQAESLLIRGLTRIISDKNISADSLEWPLDRIISDNFAAYLNVELADGETVIDIFNGNNQKKYTLFDNNKIPDTIGLADYVELRQKYNIPIEPEASEWAEYIKKNENENIQLLLEKQKRQEKIKTDNKSSWEFD